MNDKRLTQHLTAYWNAMREGSALPPFDHFNAQALEEIIGKCCAWRVETGGSNRNIPVYTSEFVGDELKEIVGSEISGEVFNPQLSSFPAMRILGKISHAVEDKAIVTDEGQFVNENNRIVKYRSCLLPFGTPDGAVTNVLLGISWKTY